MPDVLVIGAGIVGASIAYGLASRGAAVTVLEADRPAAGTSKSSFAWPNANEKLPREYFDLNFAGLAEHHRLAAELGHGAFQPTGNLEVVAGPESRATQQRKVARLRDWGYRAELIDETRARELVPDLVPPADAGFAFFSNEGWVAASLLTYHLLEAAKRAGATVRFPARVNLLSVEGRQVVGVRVDGERIPADVVVDCSGPHAAELLRPLGVAVGRQRSPGLLVVTEPMPTGLTRVLHTPRVYLRPDGAGRVLMGSEEIDAGLPADPKPSPESPECREMLHRARAVLPTLDGARIEAARLGWRPLPADGLSAVGPVPGVEGYYLVFTHSGITLGPVLGRLVAEDVLTGSPDPLLAPFRPDRLVTPV